jgi:hypothetical protein
MDILTTGFHPPGSLDVRIINYFSFSLHLHYTFESIFLKALFQVGSQVDQNGQSQP